MKTACIQMDIRHCKKQTNIDHALSMAKEALAEGAELIVLPEVARKLSLAGADILITIAEFPNPRKHHWKTLVIARAIENQIPHIACNRIGEDPYSTFFGGSMIIDAWGDVKAQVSDEECIIMHDIDMREKDTIRKTISVFDDRRPDIY